MLAKNDWSDEFKIWLMSKSINHESVIAPVPTEQVFNADSAARARTAQAFEQQAEQMAARALKAHDPSCEYHEFCQNEFCFMWEPDQIVSDPYLTKRGQ